MKKKLLMRYSLSVLAIFLAINSSLGQVSTLVSWEFSRLADIKETDLAVSSTTTDLGVEQSTLTRGPGLAFSALARAFGSNNPSWNSTTNNPTSRSGAFNNGDYFQVNFQPKAGNTVNLTALDFKLRRSSAGANTYRWAFSVNGSTFTEIESADRSFTTSDTNGEVQPSINLSTIAQLQNLTSADVVVFRIYAWGTTSLGGSFALGRYSATDFSPSLAIRGTVINPSTSTLLAWNFNLANSGTGTTGQDLFVTATTVNTDLDAPKLFRGSGLDIPTTAYANSINGISPNFESPSTATFSTAQANNEYYEFSVSSGSTSKYISLFNLNARVRRSTGGAPNYQWMYSIDEAPFVAIGSAGTIAPSDRGYVLPTVDLTAIPALKNIPSTSKITFRIYLWGATTAGGVTAIGGVSQYEIDNNEFYSGLEVKGLVTDSPLPVKLISFNAKAQTSTVSLNWSTASETDNSHFEITRSIDGKSFNDIGTTKGNGTTNSVSNYKFTDFFPELGTSYYQLKQVDLNGKASLSNVEAVNFSLNKRSFTVHTFDNQSGIKLYIYTQTAENSEIAITNMKGEQISKNSFELIKGSNSFNLPIQLSPGIYVATLISKNGNLTTKFIKE